MLSGSRPLVAMSTKSYFGVAHTLDWLARLASSRVLAQAAQVEVAVIPSFPVLGQVGSILGGTAIRWGAQDVAPSGIGAQTGEVTAAMLAECGCTYVEVGHAERRRDFGDTDRTVRAKVGQCIDNGLVPVLCVGEPARMPALDAGGHCVRQVESACRGQDVQDIVVAYEPVWAIGGSEPAPAAHIRTASRLIRESLGRSGIRGRVIYGGTAGLGMAGELFPGVDGLFLGRRAHRVQDFEAVVLEVSDACADEEPVPT